MFWYENNLKSLTTAPCPPTQRKNSLNFQHLFSKTFLENLPFLMSHSCWWNSINHIEYLPKRNCKCRWEDRGIYSQWKHTWDEDYSRATNSGLKDTGEEFCWDNGSWGKLTVSFMPVRDEEQPLGRESLEGYSSQRDHKNGRVEECGGIESWVMSQKVTWELNLNWILGD